MNTNASDLKFVCLALFLASSSTLDAQTKYLRFHTGIGLNNVKSTNYFFDDSENRVGFSGGIDFEYNFVSGMSISTGLSYSQRGYSFEYPAPHETREAAFNYDYISIPIKCGYAIGEKLKGFANIGVMPAVLLKLVHKFPIIDGQNQFTGYESFDRTDVTQRFDFGGLVELGGSYQVTDRWLVITSLMYNRSFTDSTTEDFAATSDLLHYGLTFSIGAKMQLK